MSILNNKGAMFGLDARVALAIFGALSLITGAALYDAIQRAKVVQWQSYFNELTKASEAFYVDTGNEIPITSNTSYDAEALLLSVVDLVYNPSGDNDWKGPYWTSSSYSTTATSDYWIKDNVTNSLSPSASTQLILKIASNWSSSINSNNYTSYFLCSAGNSDCAEWWMIDGSGATANLLKLFNALDEEIDNSDGAYAGMVRYSTYGNDWLYFRGRPRVL